MANVAAIFKKGDKKLPEKYRPISLTSVPGKILERIIRNEIVNHMTENSLSLYHVSTWVYSWKILYHTTIRIHGRHQALDDGNGVDIIYLDFQKAFDNVSYKRLLKNYMLMGLGVKSMNG